MIPEGSASLLGEVTQQQCGDHPAARLPMCDKTPLGCDRRWRVQVLPGTSGNNRMTVPQAAEIEWSPRAKGDGARKSTLAICDA